LKEWLESLKLSIAPTTYNAYKITLTSHIERLLDYLKDDPLEIFILLTVFYGLRRSVVLGRNGMRLISRKVRLR